MPSFNSGLSAESEGAPRDRNFVSSDVFSVTAFEDSLKGLDRGKLREKTAMLQRYQQLVTDAEVRIHGGVVEDRTTEVDSSFRKQLDSLDESGLQAMTANLQRCEQLVTNAEVGQ